MITENSNMAQARTSQPPAFPEGEPAVVREGLTAGDYFGLPETTAPHNLINGRLYVSPSPFANHQRIVLTIGHALFEFARQEGGEAFIAPMDCHLPDGNVLQPDALYIGKANLDLVHEHIVGAPDLVVEVLSRGTRRFDRNTKLGIYARNGVHEAWLVDSESETVIVFSGTGEKWTREQSVLFGEPIPSSIVKVGPAGLGLTRPSEPNPDR